MPPAASDMLRLAADFPQTTEADWRKLVDGVLKGAPFEKLVGKTYDGIAIQPLYPRAAHALPITARPAGAPWQAMQRIDHPDAKAANAQALHDLENGATGLALTIAGGKGARGFGLPPTAEAMAAALDGVHLDAGIGIELHLAPGQREVALHTIALVEKRGLDPASVDLRVGLDPIGTFAHSGVAVPWSEATAPLFGKSIGDFAKRGFRRLMVADGRVIHDAGGSEAQELAFVLAVGVTYLRACEAGGMALDAARDAMFARLSADADQFLTMAKFRALRRLWARIEESCGLAPKPLFISAETAWRMLTQRDPYVNMLRATMATFAAGVAGADAITVLPHTLALGLPDAFARRAARNTQLVLLEESNLAKVSDPAAGSGAIETLTNELCEAAWTLFQEIERAGGAFVALERGVIQAKVAATRAARQASIAKRREVLTGASEFPNLHEAKAAVLKPAPSSPSFSNTILAAIRVAEPFEALRDKSDAMLAATGVRPKVLLATLGTPADYTPRATFAKSFFETGGIEAVELSLTSPLGGGGRREAPGWGASSENASHPRPLPTEDGGRGEKLADALALSGAAIVCLCSSDKVYAKDAEAAAKALHAAGAKHIYLAGKPGDLEAPLREAGVSDFIVAGGDALKTLQDAYSKME